MSDCTRHNCCGPSPYYTVGSVGAECPGDNDTPVVPVPAISSAQAECIDESAPRSLKIETQLDGDGTEIGAESLFTGETLTCYAIARDYNLNFVSNVAGTWVLSSKAGLVVDGDLVPAMDGKSAVFTAAGVGSGIIGVTSSPLLPDSTGTISVTDIPGDQINIETASDGNGTEIDTQNIIPGQTITMYAVQRDYLGTYVGNPTATWSLLSKTDAVADGDLSSTTGTSVVFTGNGLGTCLANAVVSGVGSDSTGLITVYAGEEWGTPLPSMLLADWNPDSVEAGEGDLVSYVPDDSGNANALGGGLQYHVPTWTANGANSHAAFWMGDSLSLSKYFYVSNNFFAQQGTGGITIFFVLKLDAEPPIADTKTGFCWFSTQDYTDHLPYTNGTVYSSFGRSDRVSVGDPTAPLTSWTRLSITASSSRWKFEVMDEVLKDTSNPSPNWITHLQYATIGISGTYYADIGMGMCGLISRVLVYKGLTDQQAAQVNSYLDTTYDL